MLKANTYKNYIIMALCLIFLVAIIPSVSADVTNVTYVAGTGEAIVYGGLNLILLVFLVGCFAVFLYFDNLTARVFSFGFGYLLVIAISFVAWQMAQDFVSSAFLIEMFRIIFLVFIIGAFPLLIGSFAWYLFMLVKIKEIQMLIDKGMGHEEAERRVKNKHGKK